MGAAPRLSIVFLNFNRCEETVHTVTHLRRLLAARDDCELIAVDNGSSDGTAEFLASQSDFLTAKLCADNSGIAAYNAGFELARGSIVLVLDDDSHPLDNTCLDRLVHRFERDASLGLLACRIEDKEGRRCWSWHLPKLDREASSMAFVGCGFAIRRELFAAIGWYPGEFFLYQNELDVAIKVRMLGYAIRYDPSCRIVHRSEGAARPGWRRVFYATRNSLWLIRRYYPYPQAFYLLGSRLLIGLARAIQFQQLPAYLKAVHEGLSVPQPRQILSPALRAEFRGFWRQNSIVHAALRKTGCKRTTTTVTGC